MTETRFTIGSRDFVVPRLSVDELNTIIRYGLDHGLGETSQWPRPHLLAMLLIALRTATMPDALEVTQFLLANLTDPIALAMLENISAQVAAARALVAVPAASEARN